MRKYLSILKIGPHVAWASLELTVYPRMTLSTPPPSSSLQLSSTGVASMHHQGGFGGSEDQTTFSALPIPLTCGAETVSAQAGFQMNL